MDTTKTLITALKARLGAKSDYRLAMELGVARMTVSNWQRGRSHPGDDVALDIAEILDLDPGYVLACLAAERAESTAAGSMARAMPAIDPKRILLLGDFVNVETARDDLGAIDPAFTGYRLRNGLIICPNGYSVPPGAVMAIPLRLQQLRELQRAIETPQQWELFKNR